MPKFKIGMTVKPTKSTIEWYADLDQQIMTHEVCGEFNPSDEVRREILMWLTAKEGHTPIGKVTDFGTAGDDGLPCVRVRFKNAFGSYDGYFERRGLKRRVWK